MALERAFPLGGKAHSRVGPPGEVWLWGKAHSITGRDYPNHYRNTNTNVSIEHL